jgi:hypothetical protein
MNRKKRLCFPIMRTIALLQLTETSRCIRTNNFVCTNTCNVSKEFYCEIYSLGCIFKQIYQRDFCWVLSSTKIKTRPNEGVYAKEQCAQTSTNPVEQDSKMGCFMEKEIISRNVS